MELLVPQTVAIEYRAAKPPLLRAEQFEEAWVETFGEVGPRHRRGEGEMLVIHVPVFCEELDVPSLLYVQQYAEYGCVALGDDSRQIGRIARLEQGCEDCFQLFVVVVLEVRPDRRDWVEGDPLF